MKHKCSRLMFFAFLAFFSCIGITFAREMTFDELKALLEEKDPDMNSFYMIGHYIYTDQMILSSRDIMLSSTSIDVSEENKNGKTDQDGIYQEMAIYNFEKDVQTSEWKSVAIDVLTKKQKTLKPDDVFNVQYINYEIQAEKSDANVVLDIDGDDYTTYKEVFDSMLKFKTNESYGNGKLELKDGVVTGLLLKNDNITLSEEDEKKYNNPVYFFAYILEIPGASSKTDITVDGINGSGTIEWKDFDVTASDKTPGIAVLVPIQPDKWKDHKTIVLTVDVDGSENEEYAPTEYTIDLSGLSFQDDSKATLTDDENDISTENKEQIAEWGYKILTGADKKYTLEIDEKDPHKYNLTGKVELQHTNHGVFAKEGEDGYYFLFNLKKPEELEEVPDGVKLILAGQQTLTFGKEDFDESGVFTNLFKLNDTVCSGTTKTNCSFDVTIDWDGDGSNGQAYLPTKFTVDYSTLTFVKGSPFTITGIDEDESASQKIKDEYGWKEVDGFETFFKAEDQTIKVSGLIPILSEFDNSKQPFKGEKATGYYLPFVIKTDIAKIEGKTTIKMTRDDETKTVTTASFDGEDTIYALAYLDKDKDKTITIEVDMDGEEEEYTSYTLTLDWRDLKLQEKTVESIDVNKASDADRQGLEKYGYQSDANTNMKMDGTDGNYSVSGKLTQQVLNNDVFDENTGYYFDYTFQLPENVDFSKVQISHVKEKKLDASEENVKKTFKETSYDKESHTLTILYQFKEDPQCDKNGDNCKIYYYVDYDGDGKEYLPTLVTIDYSQLTFEKSSIFTVTGLETEEDYGFSDSGWLEKEGYSIQVNVDPENNRRYLVTGILPIFEDTEWGGSNDPLGSPNNDYYLGLLLTLADEQIQDSDEGSINVKFFHDDEDDTHFVKVFDSDFNNTKELYIMKYLVPSDEPKEFTITVDLDGDAKEEYAPYTVTIDYSGVAFQNYSLSNVDFDVLKEVDSDSPEDQELKKYQFNSDTVSGVTTHENKDQPDRPYKDGLSGKIKEQTLDAASGYDDLSGYFVPLKISFPTDSELQDYKDKWTITLYDENGKKLSAYEPTKAEYAQGWVMVVFKVKDTKEPIKYEMDFDGDGDAFLPSSYEIKIQDLEFQTENKVTFKYFDETTGTVVTTEETVYQGEPIPESLAPQLADKNYSYHTLDYWYEEGKDANDEFELGVDSTEKNQDITLKAHFTLDASTFISDVVQDVFNKNNSVFDGYGAGDMDDVYNVTFGIKNSRTKLSELDNISIPGALAYILQRGEVKDITLSFDNQKIVFTKDGPNNEVSTIDLDEEGTALKEQIKAGMTALLEAASASDMTLNQMAVEKKSLTFTIGTLDESVQLSDELKTYNINFTTKVAAVKSEEELRKALQNSEIENIDIVESFSVNETVEVNRKVAIRGETNETLTASNSENSIFKITYSGVTIEKLNLTGSKTPITIETTGNLTATSVNFTGEMIEAGILVKNGGGFTGSKITYDGEKYSKPLIKAESASNTINLTNKQNTQAKPITMQEVKRFDVASAGEYKNQIGDELIAKKDYPYKNYYNDSEVEHNFIRISYSGDRVTTSYPISFTKWYDKEDPTNIEPPDDILYLTSYSDSFANYTIEAWIQGGSVSYAKGSVPAPKEDTYYGADLKADYKPGVTTVSDEESLRKEVTAGSESKIIIIKGDKITLSEELNIQKSITIMGVEEKGIKQYATIEGKINVNADNVHFEKLNIVGTSSKEEDDQNVITVNNDGFNTYQVNVSANALTGDKKWNSLIHFTHENPKAVIYFGNFKGANSEMIINFDKAIGHESKVVGNNFEGSEDTKEFININAIGDNAEIDLRQQTATFVGKNEYGIRINASATSTKATIVLGSFWSNSVGKILEVGIDVTDEKHDASGFTFTAGAVFEDKIKIMYIKEGQAAQENNPYGEEFNATLMVGDKVVSSAISEPLKVAGLEHDGNNYSGIITQNEDGNFYIPVTLTSNHLQPNVSTVKVTDPNGHVETYTFEPSQESGIMLAMNSNTMELKLEAMKSSKIQDGKEKVYKLELDEDGADANEREIQTYTINYQNVKTEEEIILDAVQNTKDADSFTVQKNNYIKGLRDNFTYKIDNKSEIKHLIAGTGDSKVEQYSFPENLVNPGAKKYIVVEKSKSIAETDRPTLNDWRYFNQFDSVSKGIHELELLKDMVRDSGIVDAIDTVYKKDTDGHTYIVKVSHEKLASWLNLQYIDGKIEEEEKEMENHEADKETTITLEVTLDDSEEHVISLKTTTPFIVKTTDTTYKNNTLDVQITDINQTEIDGPETVLGTNESIQTFIQAGRDWWHKHTGSTSAGA